MLTIGEDDIQAKDFDLMSEESDSGWPSSEPGKDDIWLKDEAGKPLERVEYQRWLEI